MNRRTLRWDRIAGLVAVCTSAHALGTASLSAQPQPIDAQEFQVNDLISESKQSPRVAVGAGARTMFVWEHSYDSSHNSVHKAQARLFDASGQAVGDQFRVHDSLEVFAWEPVVAANGSSGFAVAWTNEPGTEFAESSSIVVVRRFDALGAPRGPAEEVHTSVAGAHFRPAIASDSLGRYTIAWRECPPADGDCSSSLQARRFGADGEANGEPFEVAPGNGNPRAPDLARTATSTVVVWTSSDSADPATSGRLFDAQGAPVDGDFEIAPIATPPSVAMDRAGSFVVVWMRYLPAEGRQSIQGRRYGSDGGAAGAPFRIDEPELAEAPFESWPRVAADASGDFVTIWETCAAPDPQMPCNSTIRARRFSADGTPQGASFRVDSSNAGHKTEPDVACDAIGNFVTVWTDDETYDTGTNIKARRYFCGLFCDGFERGDSSGWTE